MNVVARVPTPISATEALRTVSQLWPSVFGAAPTNDELALTLSLVWIETARGTRCFNNNPGNITAGDSFPNDAWRPPWFDFDGGTNVTERNVQLHELMLQGKAPKAFRSYPTLEAGATDFLRVLRAQHPEVMAAAKLGDAEKFRVALAKLFSPDFSNPHATDTLAQFQNEFLAVLGQKPKPLEPSPVVGTSSGVGLLVGAAVAAAAVGIFFATINPPRALRLHAA